MSEVLATLGRQRYISLTTFKRDGTAVATPVWLATDGAALVVTTFLNTGKVKRIRHTPRVTMAPCDMRGRVPDGAPSTVGTATIVADPAESERIASLVTRRYPVLGRLLPLIERVRGSNAGPRVGLRITLAAPAG